MILCSPLSPPKSCGRSLSFVKMQAAGNDFVLIDAVDGRRRNWPALARRVCARRLGIGADGLLVLQREKAAFRMRMFNPDGSEDMCGNGLCCVATYLHRAGHIRSTRFSIHTLTGPHQIVLAVRNGKITSVKVNLGPPRLRGNEIPVAVKAERVIDYPLKVAGRIVPITALSTGTPHAVVFSSDLAALDWLGPEIMQHPFFPEQASVSVAKMEKENRLAARTWERGGVGESLSCGTGAAAILAAAHLKGMTGREAEIIYPGGRLRVRWDSSGNLWLAGPVREVFRGTVDLSWRNI